MKTYKCGCFGGPLQMCKTHAAAPDLLEAARSAMDALITIGKENWGAVERVRAAIAKAEGK